MPKPLHTLTLTTTALLTLGLAACGTEEKAKESTLATTVASESTAPTETESSSEQAAPSPTAPATTTEQSSTAETTSNSSHELASLKEVGSSGYTGNGSGSLAGTRFTTPDETVNCHITKSVGCVVKDHGGWPAQDRANDGLGGQGIPNVIGWHDAVEAPYGQSPKTWMQQGTWPNTSASAPLNEGEKLEVLTAFDDESPYVTCGALDASTMICEAGGHGFKVSTTEYQTW